MDLPSSKTDNKVLPGPRRSFTIKESFIGPEGLARSFDTDIQPDRQIDNGHPVAKIVFAS